MLPNDESNEYLTKEYAPPPPLMLPERGELTVPTAKPDPALAPPARGLLAKWLKVLTRPSVATFASEIPAASWGYTLLGLLIFILTYDAAALVTFAQARARFGGLPGIITTGAVDFLFIETFGLIAGAVVLYGQADPVGKGWSHFATHAYLYSLYIAPIVTIATLFGLIPIVGNFIFIPTTIYAVYFTYLMIQAAHPQMHGKALLVASRSLFISLIVTFIFAIFIAFLTLRGF